MHQNIFLITGLMASGKSTISEMLASTLKPSVHLRGDIFRKMIITGRADMSEHPSAEAVNQLHLRYLLTAECAKKYFDNGFTVIIQDNYYCSELPYMLELLKGYPVHTIVLCPNVSAIRDREAQRNKKGYTGFEIEPLYHTFMSETPRIGLWIDSSTQTPQQTVDCIKKHFNL